jgi:rhodanese-related sulfurtransferase
VSVLRQATKESVFIICAAILLGFSYTFVSGKGLFAASGLAKGPSDHSAVSPPVSINLAEAKSLFEGDSALFVDARHYFDYRRGHIKSAVSIPLNEFDSMQKRIASLPRDRVIVVYCDGSECNSSIELAAKLSEEGFAGIRIFFGGWEEWVSGNLPTEKSQ